MCVCTVVWRGVYIFNVRALLHYQTFLMPSVCACFPYRRCYACVSTHGPQHHQGIPHSQNMQKLSMTTREFHKKKDISEILEMSSITITIAEDVMKTFTDFKLRHKHKYVLLEIDQTGRSLFKFFSLIHSLTNDAAVSR